MNLFQNILGATTERTHPKYGSFQLRAMTPDVLSRAARSVKAEKGDKLVEAIDLSAEAARLVIAAWKTPEGEDVLAQKPFEVRALIPCLPGLMDWVASEAKAFGEAQAKKAETDAGN